MASPAPNYSKTYPGGWQNGPSGGTPIDAAALNDMEGGIAGALQAPLSPNSGDVPIWDPTANGGAGGWNTTTNIKIAKTMLGALGIVDADVASGAAIQFSKLNGFPNDNTKFARGDGVWAVPTSGPKITESLFSGGPPGSPADGDIWIARAVDTGNLSTTVGPVWQFMYNGTEARWVFIGGAPLVAYVDTTEATGSATAGYVALTTAGPSVSAVRAGVYIVEHGAGAQNASSGTTTANVSYDIGGTGAVDADALLFAQSSGGTVAFPEGSRRQQKTLAASTTLTMKYSAGGNVEFYHRWISILPLYVT